MDDMIWTTSTTPLLPLGSTLSTNRPIVVRAKSGFEFRLAVDWIQTDKGIGDDQIFIPWSSVDFVRDDEA